ncbi:hypothetical protein EBS02_12890 [bacterium]|nr:hypothetical protein [bacterium]
MQSYAFLLQKRNEIISRIQDLQEKYHKTFVVPWLLVSEEKLRLFQLEKDRIQVLDKYNHTTSKDVTSHLMHENDLLHIVRQENEVYQRGIKRKSETLKHLKEELEKENLLACQLECDWKVYELFLSVCC